MVEALATLESDDRVACAAALETLSQATDRKTLATIAEFGATTVHPALTQRAAKIVIAVDTAKALKSFRKLRSRFKRRADRVTRVAMMVEFVPGEAAREFLQELAGHSNAAVAATSVRSLAARGEDEARGVLEQIAKSSRPAVASAAAYALVQTAPDDGTRTLLWNRVLGGADDRIGDHCAIALSTMPDIGSQSRAALELVGKRARAENFHALVKMVLRTVEDPDPGDLIRLMRSKSEEVREVGCDLAGLTGCTDETVQNYLVRVAHRDQKWRCRVAAWLALRRCGAEHVVKHIAAAIAKGGGESYWGLQCAIATPRPEYVANTRAAALDSKDPVRRDLAGRALHGLPDREATRALLFHAAET